MSDTPKHITVLLHEAVDGLAIKPDGIYIDGTFGRGGHSRLILSKLGEQGRLIAIDRDLRAIAEAKTITDPRFQIVHSAFSSIPEICEELGLIGKINGILLDLGYLPHNLTKQNVALALCVTDHWICEWTPPKACLQWNG